MLDLPKIPWDYPLYYDMPELCGDIPKELMVKLRRLHEMSLESAGRLHSLRDDILENLQNLRNIKILKDENRNIQQNQINLKA